jgi:hypothetical protein
LLQTFRLASDSVIGLYDQQGMLRFAGLDRAECLAYAELFALDEGSFSLESLFGVEPEASRVVPAL